MSLWLAIPVFFLFVAIIIGFTEESIYSLLRLKPETMENMRGVLFATAIIISIILIAVLPILGTIL